MRTCTSLQGGTAVFAVSERVSATMWCPRTFSSRICRWSPVRGAEASVGWASAAGKPTGRCGI